MAKSRETIDASVRAYAAEKRQSLDAHPEAEELAAYHRGELEEGPRESIRDHLALCGECTRLLLDLASFSQLEPPSEEYRLSDRDVEDLRASLEKRLDEGQKRPASRILEFAPRVEPLTPDQTPSPLSSIPWWYHTAAAALLVATIGLGYQVAELSSDAFGRSLSDVNPRIWSIRSDDDRLRSAGEETVVHAPADNHLTLQLTYFGKNLYARYRVELYDDRGDLIWQNDNFVLQHETHFILNFPVEYRAPGSYRFQVYGLTETDPIPLAQYRVVISEQENPAVP